MDVSPKEFYFFWRFSPLHDFLGKKLGIFFFTVSSNYFAKILKKKFAKIWKSKN